MNSLDLVLICLAAVAAFRGWRRGALLQLFTWGGLLLGLAAGTLLGPKVAGLVDGTAQAAIALGMLIGGIVGGWLCGGLLGRRFRSAARKTVLNPIDRVLGATISALGAALVVWFVAFNLVNGPYAALSTEIQSSQIVRVLDAAFPEPPAILAQVRVALDDAGFPQVFSGVPPEPAGPVPPPTDEAAAHAYAAGNEATLRVWTESCEEVRQGSGFMVAEDLLVTNAHVVAGAKGRVQVAAQGDTTSLTATAVDFDPEMDLAVLRVEGSDVEPLALASEPAQREAGGAVIGYPDGGQLTGTKAAVRDALEASGRDIYGSQMVVRPILELQTQIHPGNSGGPFLLEDGTVAGVVFAASPTDPQVGYAISAKSAAAVIEDAEGITGGVGTGPCIA